MLSPLNVHLHEEVCKRLVKRHDDNLLIPLDQALDHLHRVHVNKHALHATPHVLVKVPEKWAQSLLSDITSHFFKLRFGCYHVESDVLVLNLKQTHILFSRATNV